MEVSETRLTMTVLVLTLGCASGHSLRDFFLGGKTGQHGSPSLTTSLSTADPFVCRVLWWTRSETHLTTKSVKELKKKRTEHLFNSAEVTQFSCSPAKSGHGTTEVPPLEGTVGDEWNKQMGMKRRRVGTAHAAFDAKSDVCRNAASELPVCDVSGSMLISVKT